MLKLSSANSFLNKYLYIHRVFARLNWAFQITLSFFSLPLLNTLWYIQYFCLPRYYYLFVDLWVITTNIKNCYAFELLPFTVIVSFNIICSVICFLILVLSYVLKCFVLNILGQENVYNWGSSKCNSHRRYFWHYLRVWQYQWQESVTSKHFQLLEFS